MIDDRYCRLLEGPSLSEAQEGLGWMMDANVANCKRRLLAVVDDRCTGTSTYRGIYRYLTDRRRTGTVVPGTLFGPHNIIHIR
jgi:hypothetical protein